MNKNKKNKLIPWPYRVLRWAFPKMEKLSPYFAGKLATRMFFHPIRFKPPEREHPAIESAVQEKAEILTDKEYTLYKWGSGQRVLFVHGWSGRASQFWKFIDKFTSNGFECISFDAPAHGLSSGNSTHLLEFAIVIEELVAKYKPSLVIGHSAGGVASVLAKHRGAAINELIMIASPALTDDMMDGFKEKINGSEIAVNAVKNRIKIITDRDYEDFMTIKLLEGMKNLNLRLIYDKDDKEVGPQHGHAIKETYSSAELILTEGLGHNKILMDDEVIQYCLNRARVLSEEELNA